MIVYKEWTRWLGENYYGHIDYDGWFLFGLIPIYIRRKGRFRKPPVK